MPQQHFRELHAPLRRHQLGLRLIGIVGVEDRGHVTANGDRQHQYERRRSAEERARRVGQLARHEPVDAAVAHGLRERRLDGERDTHLGDVGGEIETAVTSTFEVVAVDVEQRDA